MCIFTKKWRENRQKNREKAYQEREACIQKVLGDSASLIVKNNGEQKKKFEKEEERLAALVAEESNSVQVTTDCNTLLSNINTLVYTPNLDRCAIIANFNKVKQRIIRAYDSRMASLTWFGPITFTNGIYLAIFVSVIGALVLIPGQARLHNTAFVCLACAMWGGFGGVVDAFFALRTHFSRQDFDDEFVPWYFLHPLQGMSMGAVIYLILTAGLLAISGNPLRDSASANMTVMAPNAVAENITSAFNNAVETGGIGATALPIAMAFLAGFRQSTMVNFLTRIVNSILGNTRDTSE